MAIKENKQTGKWEASFSKRHPITRVPLTRRKKGLESRVAAVRAERELIATVERLLHQAVTPTWSVLLEQFLKACKEQGFTMHTLHDYESALKAHTLDSWGTKLVDKITTQEIRDLIEAKVGLRSLSHQKNVLKFIRSVFTYGVEIGAIQRNPSPKMKFKIGEKVKRFLTEEQVRTFLAKARELNWEWYPHWATAIYTGMRNGELYALTWDKVNLDDRLIKIDTAWNLRDGFKSTKSGDERVVEIAPNLVTLFKELKLRNGDSHFVLPRIDKWDTGDQARELALFLKGIEMPIVRFHDLRATWATILLSKGIEPIKVMKMGGWKDLKTMMIYVRTSGVDIRGSTNCLDLHDPATEPGKVLIFKQSM